MEKASINKGSKTTNWIWVIMSMVVLALGIIYFLSFETRRNNALKVSYPTDIVLDVNGADLELSLVERGTFEMGTNWSELSSQHRPVHKVAITKDYYIGKYEVTVSLWKSVMGSFPKNMKDSWVRMTFNDIPVSCVSWNEIQIFIQKLNEITGLEFRLPTEAEWEYAALGGKDHLGYGNVYSHGKKEYAWYDWTASTHCVGGKKPNGLGIYDMLGNVSEWVNDFYDANYYSSSPYFDPKGPGPRYGHVIRGGNIHETCIFCNEWARLHKSPDEYDNNLGFRLAITKN